jgi:hypothetical protein
MLVWRVSRLLVGHPFSALAPERTTTPNHSAAMTTTKSISANRSVTIGFGSTITVSPRPLAINLVNRLFRNSVRFRNADAARGSHHGREP